jgi:hypothetical protein
MSSEEKMSTVRVCPNEPPNRKMTKREAARKLAHLAEADMERKGLSEEKRNARVHRFVEYVDAISANRAK